MCCQTSNLLSIFGIARFGRWEEGFWEKVTLMSGLGGTLGVFSGMGIGLSIISMHANGVATSHPMMISSRTIRGIPTMVGTALSFIVRNKS